MKNPPVGYKHSDPSHLDFGRSADNSLLAKKRGGYAEGGKVEFDPNASSRAGSRQYGVDEKGEFWGWKEPYPRQQELTPSESKDRNREDPGELQPWVAGQKYRTSET